MRIQLTLLLFLTQLLYGQAPFTEIKPQTDASFRGLSVVDDSIAWVSGSKGWVGRSTNGGVDWTFTQVKGFEKWDFRSLYAFDANNAVIANAGSPAYILRTNDGGQTWKVVYQNNDTAAFFDGVDFWNNNEGVIYGDPIKRRLMLLKTKDGGQTWKEMPEKNRPLMAEGEASFAASGTNIRCYDKNKIMIATGGMVSRLLISKNKSKKWNTIFTDTPGKSSAGIFSFAFKNDDTGVIVFGDYKSPGKRGTWPPPQDTVGYALYTFNGGKSWVRSDRLGYKECIEYISAETLITTGNSATYISWDNGASWKGTRNLLSYYKDQEGNTFPRVYDLISYTFHVVKKSRKGNLIIFAGSEGNISLYNPIP